MQLHVLFSEIALYKRGRLVLGIGRLSSVCMVGDLYKFLSTRNSLNPLLSGRHQRYN
jgi:hypothetical protein